MLPGVRFRFSASVRLGSFCETAGVEDEALDLEGLS